MNLRLPAWCSRPPSARGQSRPATRSSRSTGNSRGCTSPSPAAAREARGGEGCVRALIPERGRGGDHGARSRRRPCQHAKRKGFVEKPLKTPRPCRTDAITADVSRAVWTRAGDRCEVVLPSGERCDSIADDDWPDLRPRRRHAARPRASGTRAGHAWRETFRPLASRAPIARHRFRHSAPVRRPGLRLEPARILRLPQAGAFSTSVAPVSATEVL
jgi:hypothetical protein